MLKPFKNIKQRWAVKLIPFKVPHPLFPVVAQLVDVHHASVPHHVGRVDEIAWRVRSQLPRGFSPVKSGTSL